MRIRTDIWVKAYIRRLAVAGVAAAVVRHGDDHAGAVFIRVNRLDGNSLLFGPAPAGLEGAAFDRQWVACVAAQGVPDAEVEAYLEREQRIDPDLWIVEAEDRAGRHFLEGWLADVSR